MGMGSIRRVVRRGRKAQAAYPRKAVAEAMERVFCSPSTASLIWARLKRVQLTTPARLSEDLRPAMDINTHFYALPTAR